MTKKSNGSEKRRNINKEKASCLVCRVAELVDFCLANKMMMMGESQRIFSESYERVL